MGRGTRTHSVAGLMVLLMKQRRWWSQAELARELSLTTESVRTLVGDLVEADIALESRREHPHVYWRVPKTWYPGAVLVEKADVGELLRLLMRLPKTKGRDRLLDLVIGQLPAHGVLREPAPVRSRATSEHEEEYLTVVEHAAASRAALQMRYLTASRNQVSERHVSVHLVDVGPPARFVATCHRNGDLRWFRVDSIVRGRPDTATVFRTAERSAVDAFVAASLDGFKGDGATRAYSFFVREPEARWVATNLLEGMRPEALRDGVRVHIETSGLLRLARFVASLGDAADPEDIGLARAVAEIARGGLERAEARIRAVDREAARASSAE